VKSAIEQLSPNDREALALLYDKNDYQVLKKLIAVQKSKLAEAHVGQLEINQIRYLTGQVASLNWLIEVIKQNFNEVNKKS
jgi:hypothetical protein